MEYNPLELLIIYIHTLEFNSVVSTLIISLSYLLLNILLYFFLFYYLYSHVAVPTLTNQSPPHDSRNVHILEETFNMFAYFPFFKSNGGKMLFLPILRAENNVGSPHGSRIVFVVVISSVNLDFKLQWPLYVANILYIIINYVQKPKIIEQTLFGRGQTPSGMQHLFATVKQAKLYARRAGSLYHLFIPNLWLN